MTEEPGVESTNLDQHVVDAVKSDEQVVDAPKADAEEHASWAVGAWLGKPVLDRDGERIGKLQDVYVDVETDEPQFGTVKEGMFPRHLTFVPLVGVQVGPDPELHPDRQRERTSTRSSVREACCGVLPAESQAWLRVGRARPSPKECHEEQRGREVRHEWTV